MRALFLTRTAGVVVSVGLGLIALLAVVLLALSMVPTGLLAARLLGAANAARNGTYTQDLLTYLGQRLRLAAVLLLVLLAGLAVLRNQLRELLCAALDDLTSSVRWPARADVAPVAALSALAIGIRVPFLSQPIRYDEALTFNEFASRPLYYALSFYPDPNNHLLNTLLVHVAALALGSAPWVLRLPACAGGVLLVAATYGLAHELYGRLTAVLAGVLVAVSSYLVEYSTNARGYTLQTLCFVLTLWLAIVSARRDSPTALVLATLAAALGAYALPTMFYGAAIVAGWIILERRTSHPVRISQRHLLASALLLGLIVTVAYLPVILVSGADKLVSNRFVVPLELPELRAELPASLAHTWAFWNRDLSLVVSALLAVGFITASLTEARRKRVPLGVLAPIVCLAIAIVQRVAPFERVWLFLLPLYFTVASGGLSGLFETRGLPGFGGWAAALLLAVCLTYFTLTSGSILSSPETGAFPDAQAVTRTLQSALGADDAVLTSVPASLPELQYYFARAGLGTDALVRSTDAAQRLFVIAPPGVEVGIAGWRDPQELGRFSGSVLLQLHRG